VSTNFRLRDEQFHTGYSSASGNLTHELKSASTSSLNNSNNCSESQRLNHSYQNGSHPLSSMQQQARLRAMNAYDSQSSSPLQTSMSNNSNHNNMYSYQEAHADQAHQYHYNQVCGLWSYTLFSHI